jgi:hypothetical protein
MFPLRILLLVLLVAEGLWLAWHTPWKAESIYNDVPMSAPLPEDAPFFRPPPKPNLTVFGNRISPFIDPATVEIRLSVDHVALYGRFALLMIGTFFIYGVIAWFLTKRPRPADVAYSLSVSTGFLVGLIASAVTGRFVDTPARLPWLNLFWAAGVGTAFVVTLLSRRRPGDQT